MSCLEIHPDHLILPYHNGITLKRNHSDTYQSLSSLMNLPCNVYLFDHENIMRGTNDQHVESIGFNSGSAREAIGKSVTELPTTKKTVQQIVNNNKEVMNNKAQKITEEIVYFNDGRVQPFLSIKMPWYDNNKIVGIFGCSIMIGQHPLAESLSGLIASGLINQGNQFNLHRLKSNFTLREQDIIKLLVRGKTAREIGEELYLSRRTIEHYIESIKDKMGVQTKSQLIEKLLT